MRSRRVPTTSPDFRVAVLTWELLRHAIVTRFPREQWDGDVIGEAVWYDAADRELRRESVHLGRRLP
jgi:hypothetical protein